jgi:nicotinamide-nucleotide amidase
VLRTAGIGESRIDAAIADLETAANPTVGLSAHAGQTDIRIAAKASNEAEADRLIAPVEAEIRRRLGINIYGVEKETVEEVLLRQLAQAGWTLAVAEAGTGGLLTNRLANTPGSEAVFGGGTTAADAERLGNALGLGELSADPEEAARQLAEHIACGEKCIGLVALVLSRSGQEQATSTEGTIVAWTTPQGVQLKRHGFGGHTAHAARWATTRALDLVRRWLLKQPG